MTVEELRESARQRVAVTRPDIVAAKFNLLTRMTSAIEVRAEADRWAELTGGTVPQRVQADSADDQLVAMIARGIVARLATVAASFELTGAGLAFQVGNAWEDYSPSLGQVWHHGYGGGIAWPELNVSHPTRIGRPVWYDRPGRA